METCDDLIDILLLCSSSTLGLPDSRDGIALLLVVLLDVVLLFEDVNVVFGSTSVEDVETCVMETCDDSISLLLLCSSSTLGLPDSRDGINCASSGRDLVLLFEDVNVVFDSTSVEDMVSCKNCDSPTLIFDSCSVVIFIFFVCLV